MLHRLLMTIMLALGLGACSADPEADSPGSCALSCSSRRVASSDFKIVPLSPETTISISCAADFSKKTIQPLNGPVTIRYKVTSEERIFTGGKSGGDASAGLVGAETITVPRAGVSFEPTVSGVLSFDKTNSEHLNGDGSVTPFKFGGIVTPSTEWCSDSCGVITYEFWPSCVENTDNSIVAGVLAGAVETTGSYSITVSNSTGP